MMGSRGAVCLPVLALALASACSSEGPHAAATSVARDKPSPSSRVEGPPAPPSSATTAAGEATAGAGAAAAGARAAATGAGAGAAADSPAPAPPAALDRARYPWLVDSSVKGPDAIEPLSARFAPPAGYRRVPLADGSFGAWLRGLPLAPPGTPVVSFQGGVILPDGHENLAAVVAIDVGAGDLQQCADSVIRMHAEWQWAAGSRAMSYRAASGTPMPFARWARGERPVPSANGQSIQWEARARPDPDGSSHPSFRKYLDNVFMWANTGGLAVQAKKIARESIRPGDFVVMPGSPGHAVLVLDMAVSDRGERAALLGQGFMPAQSFQVLRPDRGHAWFPLDLGGPGLTTPFWPTFPWDALRRLDEP